MVTEEARTIMLDYIESIKLAIENRRYHAASLLVRALSLGLANCQDERLKWK